MPDIILCSWYFHGNNSLKYSGLPVNLPKAKRIEKLKSKRKCKCGYLSGLISIDDRLIILDDVSSYYDKHG